MVGEIATQRLLVVLNKIDLLPAADRPKLIARACRRLGQTLAGTKFASCPMVTVAAKPGVHSMACHVDPRTLSACRPQQVFMQGVHLVTSCQSVNPCTLSYRQHTDFSRSLCMVPTWELRAKPPVSAHLTKICSNCGYSKNGQ